MSGIYKYTDWGEDMNIFLSDDQIIERIASRCRARRLELEMTQSDLAHQSNLSLITIKKFETYTPPSFKTLIAILRALGDLHLLSELMNPLEESAKSIHLGLKETYR
mgnify:CR=1 FL=1